ncbi:MAG: hypothetical protein KJN76_05335 [Eudoraea sp.]|nr:hypothetical protein [Eudoraea sp.]
MGKLNKWLRKMLLILVICLACMVPIPVVFLRKEESDQTRIEQLDEDEEVDREGLKELF